MPFTADLPAQWLMWAHWVGLVLSLLLASMVLREAWPARLAQYILVGTGVGYSVVLAWQHVLRPRLWVPLTRGMAEIGSGGALPGGDGLWLVGIPLLLGLMMWAAGVDLLRGSRDDRIGRILRGLGAVPGGVLLGVGVGVAVAGAIQGTLGPQFLRAAQLAGPQVTPGALRGLGILALLISGGTLLAWLVDESTEERIFGRGLGWAVRLWRGLGQRALWLAAGVLLARLFFSRFTLLSARIQFLGELVAQQVGRWLAGGGP